MNFSHTIISLFVFITAVFGALTPHAVTRDAMKRLFKDVVRSLERREPAAARENYRMQKALRQLQAEKKRPPEKDW